MAELFMGLDSKILHFSPSLESAMSVGILPVVMLVGWYQLYSFVGVYSFELLTLGTAKGRIPGIWKLSFFSRTPTTLTPKVDTAKSVNDDNRMLNLLPAVRPTFFWNAVASVDDGESSDGSTSGGTLAADILLKLNADGSFRQCSEDYVEGCWMSGQWRLQYQCNNSSTSTSLECCSSETESKEAAAGAAAALAADAVDVACSIKRFSLVLAMDRQYYGPRHDTLLQGTFVDSDSASTSTRQVVVHGCVKVGKFVYPKRHPLFFDPPILVPIVAAPLDETESANTTAVSFVLEQAVSAASLAPSTLLNNVPPLLESEWTPKPKLESAKMYQVSDFYGRTFYMTVEPLPQHTPKERKSITKHEETALNVQAMPVTFHANHTFQAWGIHKILRGRFGIVSTKEQQPLQELWFQVSLFGAGRSAPGSVYSEGMALSHDDERHYVGEILQDLSRHGRTLYVVGTVTIGSDMGSDARPEPVGTFQLVETKDSFWTASMDDKSTTTRTVWADNTLGSFE